MNAIVTRSLVPPRPNLGPEPWRENGLIKILPVALALLGSAIVGWLLIRRLRRRRVRLAESLFAHQSLADATPRERLVGLSNTIREALNVQFGPAWRAKTTKELAGDPQLAQTIGAEGFDELIRFLDQVDLLKFAPARADHRHESLQHQFTVWQPKVSEWRARIRAGTPVRRNVWKHSANANSRAPERQLTER